jgi:carboxylesterase
VGPEPIERGDEFELPGGPDAALLLHGLTGSSFELLPVARRLARDGHRVLAPLLAGHGGSPQDLIGVPWSEWLAKARRDLHRLEGARRTFVVGCSTGALLACALAHDLPAEVNGLALLAPALELAPPGRFAALLGKMPGLRETVFPKGKGSDVFDPEMRRRNPCMGGVPLSAVAELTELASYVSRLLSEVKTPALVVQGARDHTVTVAGARRLARRIGSGPAELILLPRSFHLVGIDVERDRCADEVARFLDSLPLPGRRAELKARPTR